MFANTKIDEIFNEYRWLILNSVLSLKNTGTLRKLGNLAVEIIKSV